MRRRRERRRKKRRRSKKHPVYLICSLLLPCLLPPPHSKSLPPFSFLLPSLLQVASMGPPAHSGRSVRTAILRLISDTLFGRWPPPPPPPPGVTQEVSGGETRGTRASSCVWTFSLSPHRECVYGPHILPSPPPSSYVVSSSSPSIKTEDLADTLHRHCSSTTCSTVVLRYLPETRAKPWTSQQMWPPTLLNLPLHLPCSFWLKASKFRGWGGGVCGKRSSVSVEKYVGKNGHAFPFLHFPTATMEESFSSSFFHFRRDGGENRMG